MRPGTRPHMQTYLGMCKALYPGTSLQISSKSSPKPCGGFHSVPSKNLEFPRTAFSGHPSGFQILSLFLLVVLGMEIKTLLVPGRYSAVGLCVLP